jgi:hypothetical protein
MRFASLITLSGLVIWLASSCSQSSGHADVWSSVSAIRQYADSFDGLSMAKARGRLAEGKVIEESWGDGELGGKQLVASFPQHEIRVMFFDGKVIKTSIQILSE